MTSKTSPKATTDVRSSDSAASQAANAKVARRLSSSGLFNVTEGFLSFDELAREANAAHLIDANLMADTLARPRASSASAAPSSNSNSINPSPVVAMATANTAASSASNTSRDSSDSEPDDGFVQLDVSAGGGGKSDVDQHAVHNVHFVWSTQLQRKKHAALQIDDVDDTFSAADLADMDSFGIPLDDAQYAVAWRQEPPTPAHNSGDLPLVVTADTTLEPAAAHGDFQQYRFCEAFGVEPPPALKLHDTDTDADVAAATTSDDNAAPPSTDAAPGGGAYDESFVEPAATATTSLSPANAPASAPDDKKLSQLLASALEYCQTLPHTKMEALAKSICEGAASAGDRGDFVRQLLSAIDAQRDVSKSSSLSAGFNERLDWNYRFQQCVESLQTGDTPEQLSNAFSDLSNLAQDFIHSARTYGKIIISEVFLPDNEKTIRPMRSLGGFAGGLKYLVNRTMFKFAVDSSGLYGSDVIAAKAAGHDLKGLKAYFNAGVPLLHFPLVCLVDYMGFRLVAISLLPIGADTIVYGSSDAGRSVHASDAKFNSAMELAAERLNIRGHFAGPRNAPTYVHSAADIEGHCGRDGRRYLIDLGRAMPPIKPVSGVRNAHLYRLFRPEFVRHYPKPLCSDGFSGFVAHDPRCNEYNTDLVHATNVLYKRVIPELARELDAAFAMASTESAAATGASLASSGTHALGASTGGNPPSPTHSARSSSNDTPEGIELNDVPFVAPPSAPPSAAAATSSLSSTTAAAAASLSSPAAMSRTSSAAATPSRHSSSSRASSTAHAASRSSGSLDDDASSYYSTPAAAAVLTARESGVDASSARAVGIPAMGASSSLSAALLFGGLSATERWTPARLKDCFHAKGVNLCFAGAVRHYVHSDTIKMLLLIEMIARVVKIVARERIRNKMRDLRVPLEQPYRRVVVDYLNTVFGNGAESRAYWAGSLKRRLHKSFMFGLSDRESQPSFDLQQLFVGTRHMCTLFERVATLSGFKFATASFVEFVSHPAAFAHAAPFDETDLEAIQERIKHMNIVAAAQAHALKSKTTQREGDRNARLLRASVAKFRSALADNPHDKTTLVALADTLSSLGEFADADRYYVAALELDANDFALMFQYASFLEKSHKYDKAETYFMKAFYVNPNEDNISQHIGDFLARRGKVTEALTFYEFAKATDAVKVDEVFENERRATLLSAYTSRHMVRMPRWSDKSGKAVDELPRAAPAGWEWIQPKWIIDRQGADTDEEGWRYAFSWSSTFAGRSGMGTFVRRRRWIRTRRRIDADARAAATPMSPPSKLQSSAARQSTKGGVLGVVAAMRAGGAHASTAVPSGGKRDEATSHSPITRAVMRTESSTAIAAPAPRASTVGFGSSASVVASSALTSSATTLAVAASAPSLGFDRSHSADPDALARVWSNTPAAAAASPLATTAASAATATTATAAVALTSSSSFLSSSSAAPLTAANLRASAEAGDGDKLEDATATATQFVQRLEPGHPAAVHSMALHGRTVWVGLADGSVYTWRSDKKSRQRLLGIGPATDGASVTFEPVSAMCTVGAFVWVGGSKLTVWNAAERTLEATLEEHNASAITLLQLIPPESVLAQPASATTTPRGNDGAGYRVVSGSLRASSLVVWDAERRVPLRRIAVHGERGPRRSCLLGPLLIIDAGRFLLAYDSSKEFAEVQRFRAHKSGLVSMIAVGRAQLWTTDGLTLTVWRRRSTGQIVEVSQQIDDCFDQRIHSLLRVRSQVWAGCSRSVVCWDARTLDPSQMLHGSHVESICNMIQVDGEHVWSVSDTDRCLCVWRLGKEAAARQQTFVNSGGSNGSGTAGGGGTSLSDSNPSLFV